MGMNNSGAGATQKKSGDHFTPICRASGHDKTKSASVESMTRSRYKGSNKHYHYERSSFFGDNENVHGYHPE